jgi:hypothetical protein
MPEVDQHAPGADAPAPPSDLVSRVGTAGILVYLAGIALALMYLLISSRRSCGRAARLTSR